MMRMKTKSTMFTNGVPTPVPAESRRAEWELRPGGMLVQKRNPDSDHRSIPPPTIRVRVKYGSVTHEISISSQSTFGELKKMLIGPTGLSHQDQKLIYKDKERDSKAFLDITGVKDKSKIVLVEDPLSQERRYVEMRKNAKLEKASKTISEISLEVDRLAGRVSALELVIGKGGKVAEKDVLGLIELLMNELLKLDGIMGDGDVKLQRKMQVKRVQKYVETLDMLKVKNSIPNGTQKPMQQQQQDQTRQANGHNRLAPIDEHPPRYTNVEQKQQHQYHQHQQPLRTSNSGPVVVTTQWETFDSTPPPPSIVPGTSTMAANNGHQQQPKFPWEFFG